MSIGIEEVTKVAKLARLRLEESDLEGFAAQMDGILAYMEKLGAVDTNGVEPLYSPVLHETPLREDKAAKTFSRDNILANAPATDGQFFIVPKIV